MKEILQHMRLTHKIIKEMCGTVSFKKGDSFYRKNKVTMEEYDDYYCKAIVHGSEDFYVTVSLGEKGRIETSCSCPPLLNYTKSCQHIAAVLIAIYERKRNERFTYDEKATHSTNQDLSIEFMSLFDNRRQRTSGHQLHFEKRTNLDVLFTLKPFSIGRNRYLFGTDLQIGQVKVQNIKAFLEAVKLGKSYTLSADFTYDPTQYCFDHETDLALHQLILISRDDIFF